jgi:hypothetical protein
MSSYLTTVDKAASTGLGRINIKQQRNKVIAAFVLMR